MTTNLPDEIFVAVGGQRQALMFNGFKPLYGFLAEESHKKTRLRGFSTAGCEIILQSTVGLLLVTV